MDRLVTQIKVGTDWREALLFQTRERGKTTWVPVDLSGITRVTLRLRTVTGEQVGKIIDSDDAGFGAGQPFDNATALGTGWLMLHLGPYVGSLTGEDEIPAGVYDGRIMLYGEIDGTTYPNGLPWSDDVRVYVED